MAQSIRPHLMFEGRAEEAMNLYAEVFDEAEIVEIERWGPDEEGEEGTVKRGLFSVGGREFSAGDSPPIHDFSFTPSISLFVDCEDADELERVYRRLSEEGEVLMPLDEYGFSTRFGWVNDRFGVSWQLNLP